MGRKRRSRTSAQGGARRGADCHFSLARAAAGDAGTGGKPSRTNPRRGEHAGRGAGKKSGEVSATARRAAQRPRRAKPPKRGASRTEGEAKGGKRNAPTPQALAGRKSPADAGGYARGRVSKIVPDRFISSIRSRVGSCSSIDMNPASRQSLTISYSHRPPLSYRSKCSLVISNSSSVSASGFIQVDRSASNNSRNAPVQSTLVFFAIT